MGEFMCKFQYVVVEGIILFFNFILTLLQSVLFCNKNHDFKKICIYKIGNIGDMICAIPAMYKVRQTYPQASITLLTSGGGYANAVAVLHDVKWLNEIVTYDVDRGHTLKSVELIFNKVKNAHYDLLINLPAQNSSFFTQLRNLIFFRCTGIHNTGNFYVSQIKLFAKAQTKYKKFPKEVDRLIQGLPFMNIQPIVFPNLISEEDKIQVDKLLKKDKLEDKKNRLLAISFGGKGEVQHWSLNNFIKVAKKWINHGGVVVLLGGKNERKEADIITNSLQDGKVFNFAGNLTITQSIYFLTCCKLLLTIDTGTAHMAAAINTACIELCTAYDFPNKWVAYGDKVVVIRKNLECSPCLKKKCQFGYPARCMLAITVDEVWNQVINMFSNRRDI